MIGAPTIGVDPGIRGSGVSVFAGDGRLLWARYVVNAVAHGRDMRAVLSMAAGIRLAIGPSPAPSRYRLVLERPQIYREARLKGDPNDLVPLAMVGAALAACLEVAEIVEYMPRDWKGTVDPDECCRRVEERLSPSERAEVVLPAKSLAHNVWDAIGIGMKALGRFERRRVIAR